MHIERGNFFRRADDFIQAGDGSKEAAKFGESGEDRLAAALDDERDKADELNAIAETLLAIEENPAVFQVAAIPQAFLRISSGGWDIVGFPAGFVADPAFAEFSFKKLKQSQIPLGQRKIGLDGQGLAEEIDCLVDLA